MTSPDSGFPCFSPSPPFFFTRFRVRAFGVCLALAFVVCVSLFRRFLDLVSFLAYASEHERNYFLAGNLLFCDIVDSPFFSPSLE